MLGGKGERFGDCGNTFSDQHPFSRRENGNNFGHLGNTTHKILYIFINPACNSPRRRVLLFPIS